MHRPRLRFAPIVLLVLLLAAGPARADLSEFETWRFDLQDADDEYPLDRLQTEYPPAWDELWRSRPTGARTANNCSTHDLWEMRVEAKAVREMGRGLEVSYRYFQEDLFSHRSRWNELGLGWRAPGGQGLAIFYRPRFQKSEHDLGLRLGWLAGPRRGLQLDVLFQAIVNNRIARKESLEGRERRIYQRHPLFLDLLAYRDFLGSGRMDLDAGLLLTTRRTHYPPAVWLPDPDFRQRLEGGRGRLRLRSPSRGPWRVGLELGGKDGSDDTVPLGSATEPLAGTESSGALAAGERVGVLAAGETAGNIGVAEKHTRRKEWWIRPSIELRLAPGLRGDCLFEYRSKQETSTGPGLPPAGDRYRNLCRTWKAGIAWEGYRGFTADFGYAGSGVSIVPTEDPDWIPAELRHASRRENRLYLTLGYRRNGVALLFTESFELDREAYDTVLLHDKSFFQIMVQD